MLTPMGNNSTAIIFVIVIVVALVVGIAWQVKASRERAERDKADSVIARLPTSAGALRLTAAALIDGEGPAAVVHPLGGLKASIEDSGTVNRRFTLTRMATLGVAAFALPKKLDDRELYLTIEGPSTVIVRAIALKNNPTASVAAREFVSRVNMAALAVQPGGADAR